MTAAQGYRELVKLAQREHTIQADATMPKGVREQRRLKEEIRTKRSRLTKRIQALFDAGTKYCATHDVVVTCYETLANEFRIHMEEQHKGRHQLRPSLFNVLWSRIVLDEPHQLHSVRGYVTHEWTTRKACAVLQLKAPYRWCVTSTFIARGNVDLFSLVRFLRRGYSPVLDCYYKAILAGGSAKRGRAESLWANPAMDAKIRQLTLARSLDQIPELPPIHWSVEFIKLLDHEKKLSCLAYSVVGAFFRDMVPCGTSKLEEVEQNMKLMAVVEDILTAPFSFVRRKVDDKSLAGQRFFQYVRKLPGRQQPVAKLVQFDRVVEFNVVSPSVNESRMYWYHLVSLAMYSSKFMELEKLLLQCKERNERALVYVGSPYTLMFAVYYLRLKGSVAFGHTSTLVRQRGELQGAALFQKFSDPTSPYTALLMGLQRTSVGLNLMSANHVIFLDTQVDKASIVQAVGRIRRIGQTKEQHVKFLSHDLPLDKVELGYLLRSKVIPDNAVVPDVVQMQSTADYGSGGDEERMLLYELKCDALRKCGKGDGPVDIFPTAFDPDIIGE
mmetsp:Transcript_127883/g.221018  ORF Transcript_127883/g.221018 Transcript_127883/m.221018 type:complete len:557 (-) Transcript_127883:111-1781(-)